jgi:hypothetical protein
MLKIFRRSNRVGSVKSVEDGESSAARSVFALGQIIFTGAGGAEQPVWDAAIQRFLITLPGTSTQAPEVAIVDPKNIGQGLKSSKAQPQGARLVSRSSGAPAASVRRM